MADKIDELLTRGVEKIYPSKDALEKVLRSGKRLKLYQGFDPTGIQLHIGHLVGLMKLRQFQYLGHEVIFLVGDGTGQAGDPSGKTRSREQYLSIKQLRQNAADYVKQAGKIVQFSGKNPAKILYNSDWLNKLSLVEILNIAGHFTLQQLEERELFQQRKQKGEPINLREFLYPLLQAYDSVEMKVDLEIGGSDQTFNMLCGRTLVKEMLEKEKFVLTTPLLTDSKGKKIGKTEGNVIALTAPAVDLYGMIMNLPDDVIINSFLYLTEVPTAQIQTVKEHLDNGDNPMIAKKLLAFTITNMLNSQQLANEAQIYFENTVQKRETPEHIPVVSVRVGESVKIVELLLQTKLVTSKSQGKQLIKEGAVSIDTVRITDTNEDVTVTSGMIIKAGKRKFVKIK